MKKIFIQSIILSVFAFSFTVTLSGQEKIIHGKVTTFNIIPVGKASITVKSTKKVTFSDSLGKFTVLCLPKDKLKVTARGFSSRNVKTNEQTKPVKILFNQTLAEGQRKRFFSNLSWILSQNPDTRKQSTPRIQPNTK